MERYLLHEFTMHLLKPPRIYWFVPGKIRPVSDMSIFCQEQTDWSVYEYTAIKSIYSTYSR